MVLRWLPFYMLMSLSGYAQHNKPLIPKGYVAHYAPQKPTIDGRLDDPSWGKAEWSDKFVDIEGDIRPQPAFATRMKMMWDDAYFYIGVEMEEPHIWATYTEPESVIFHENDIEVFLDINGDTHNYYEWEINALGTLWDLLLTKPYKDGGTPLNGWNINNFEYAIHLEGTINDPNDKDEYWSVEMAIPWASLDRRSSPTEGDQWRINFSRVQWRLDVENGTYRKVINPETGKSFPEDNWVWSPMGEINMHIPERWGYVQFTETPVGEGNVAFKMGKDEEVKNQLRDFYHAQKAYFRNHRRYAASAEELGMNDPGAEFEVSRTRFKISLPSQVEADRKWYIVEDSRIWRQ